MNIENKLKDLKEWEKAIIHNDEGNKGFKLEDIFEEFLDAI